VDRSATIARRRARGCALECRDEVASRDLNANHRIVEGKASFERLGVDRSPREILP
jgi:hypothetical protein